MGGLAHPPAGGHLRSTCNFINTPYLSVGYRSQCPFDVGQLFRGGWVTCQGSGAVMGQGCARVPELRPMPDHITLISSLAPD